MIVAISLLAILCYEFQLMNLGGWRDDGQISTVDHHLMIRPWHPNKSGATSSVTIERGSLRLTIIKV